jgi:hypothetical protein
MKPVIKKTEEVIELIETIDNDELSLSLSLLFSSLSAFFRCKSACCKASEKNALGGDRN